MSTFVAAATGSAIGTGFMFLAIAHWRLRRAARRRTRVLGSVGNE